MCKEHNQKNEINLYQDVLSQIQKQAEGFSKETETVKLKNAFGRTLSAPVFAKESVPPFDNSSVDGFAVRSIDLTEDGSNRLTVVSRTIAGDLPASFTKGACAVEIMTGAPVPKGGFDLILKVEDVLKTKNANGLNEIEFPRSAASALFIRPQGGDFKAGDCAAEAGVKIDAKVLMALSALGILEVGVIKNPRVWIVSTGNEIVEPDQEAISLGEIRNCTAPFLVEELKKLGCDVFYKGIVKDNLDGDTSEYERLVGAALSEQVDLLVSTGAVSMGVHDFVTETITKLGAETIFHKVAIRPGKPILFAKFPRARPMYFFGLPGNPISSVVGTQFFIRPFLQSYFGHAKLPAHRAFLVNDFKKPEGVRCFFKARFSTDEDGKAIVQALSGQASFMIHSILDANAWVVFPEEGSFVKKDSLVDVILFD